MRVLLAALTLTILFAAPAAAQQPAATPTATSCAQAQAVIDSLLASANARVEAARLTNSAADMRAAVDGLQSVIRDVRTQLAPCATQTAAADPHAGHEQAAASTTATLDIGAWLKSFDAAFMAKDLDELAAFYHPNVTIYEGTGVDSGWTTYRDTHLGPELKSFSGLEFGHTNASIRMLGDHFAYATSEFFLKTQMNGKPLDLVGRETLILEHADGAWKIRHAHLATRSRVK